VSRAFKQVFDGDWVYPRHNGYRMRCCDCGLVHRVNFRVVKDSSGQLSVRFQAFRAGRATAMSRRYMDRVTYGKKGKR
jgi:hypothetical protein